jgi:hypothetical protein
MMLKQFEYDFKSDHDFRHPSEKIYDEIKQNYLEHDEFIIKKINENNNCNNYTVIYITNNGNCINAQLSHKKFGIKKVTCNDNKSYSDFEIKCIHSYIFKINHYSKIKKEFDEFMTNIIISKLNIFNS